VESRGGGKMKKLTDEVRELYLFHKRVLKTLLYDLPRFFINLSRKRRA